MVEARFCLSFIGAARSLLYTSRVYYRVSPTTDFTGRIQASSRRGLSGVSLEYWILAPYIISVCLYRECLGFGVQGERI